MGKLGTWKVQPINNEIVTILVRHKGEMLDSELLRTLQSKYVDITRNTLYKCLFTLEVSNIIEVIRLRQNKYKISLRKDAPIDESFIDTLKNYTKS
ncbi:MAG: transcriptional repressor [Candidatus Lokiarchaeota archaeon]|nr:transcriptional repressor [Candidatus Lokiarchaeota archaeon]